MKIVYNIIKLFILLVFLILAISNTQVVEFFYLPGQQVNLALIVLLFGAFVIGAILGLFALFGRLLVFRTENNRLRNELKKHMLSNGKDSLKADANVTITTALPKE